MPLQKISRLIDKVGKNISHQKDHGFIQCGPRSYIELYAVERAFWFQDYFAQKTIYRTT